MFLIGVLSSWSREQRNIVSIGFTEGIAVTLNTSLRKIFTEWGQDIVGGRIIKGKRANRRIV